MSEVKPKVVWEGVVDAYPLEGATVRIVALRDDAQDSRTGLNRLVCEVKGADALDDPSWTLATDAFEGVNDDGSSEFEQHVIEHVVFAAALLSMANKAREDAAP